ncbi:hypothetical protein JXJ21_11125 [candidate division KSB1 bacterium]|nr:hypothetical protein [candidate division KSB1 bacterium]
MACNLFFRACVFFLLYPISGATVEYRDIMVFARDGTALATCYSKPEGDGSFPVILIRTPYNRAIWWKEDSLSRASAWNREDYAVVVQNIRGSGNSRRQLCQNSLYT